MKKYTLSDFQDDFSEEENYFDDEDELSFIHSLTRAFDGDEEYVRLMGQIYSSRGYGVKVDCAKAAFWYRRGAESGDLISVVRLADLYCEYEKDGFPKDLEKAFKLYEFAAKEGDIHSSARAGIMYAHGLGCKADMAIARKYLASAAAENDREACYEYARILRGEGADGWEEYLKRSAYMSYGKASLEVVKLFGDELDDVKYILYLTHAANDYSFGYDPAEAQITLAQSYLNGTRTKKNLKAAESYYKLAAERGRGEELIDFARRFVDGDGVQRNFAEAVRILGWFENYSGSCEEELRGRAAELTGDCYLTGGYGLESDLSKAVGCYTAAEECGIKTACKKLGDMYYFGTGVKQSYLRAAELYEKAAFYYEIWCDGGYDGEGYDLTANVALGDMYMRGIGVEKDLSRAFGFYYDAGYGKFYAPAMSKMAECYYNGDGVAKDGEKAEYWWNEAAQKGDESAKKALKKYFGVD